MTGDEREAWLAKSHAAAIEEIERLEDECRRAHAGLDRVLAGVVTLPDPTLGQDAAAVAALLRSRELKAKADLLDLRDRCAVEADRAPVIRALPLRRKQEAPDAH